MALGNANTSAQSRGKNKPVIVKRRKEIVTAKNYTRIAASTVQRSSACALDTRSACTESYYHDGSAALPQVGDKVYSTQRAGEEFLLLAGHYKTTNFVLFQSFEINRTGVVAAVTVCKS
tara:strand:- start:48 stop:404 length:357 start_codon:yes stop_codon:yes gene_type:complete